MGTEVSGTVGDVREMWAGPEDGRLAKHPGNESSLAEATNEDERTADGIDEFRSAGDSKSGEFDLGTGGAAEE